MAPVDAFVVIAAGRCPFTTTGLLGLTELIDQLRLQPTQEQVVRRITP